MLLLDVPYLTQVDNSTSFHGLGSRQCNLTSQTMFLMYIQQALKGHPGIDPHPDIVELASKNGYRQPESYYGEMLYPFGDTTDNNANTSCLREVFKLETRFITNGSLDQVRTILDHGYPVPAGVCYKSSGHWIVIVGYDITPNGIIWIVNDPYGCRVGSQNYYSEIGGNSGKNDTYTNDTMEQIWGGKHCGYIRIPISYHGLKLTTGV